jgi:hypothetical protein
MHEALKRVEAHDGSPGAAVLDLDHATNEIEADQQHQHPNDCDRADPVERNLVEFPPFATGWLDQHAFLLVRDADAALNSVQLLKELLFTHRTRIRIDRSVRISVLRIHWCCKSDGADHKKRTDRHPQGGYKVFHPRLSPFLLLL